MKFLVTALVLILLASPAMAQSSCGGTYPDSPDQLAASLLPTLERLYAAIPSLSPQEEQWLKEELVAEGRRPVRAANSREAAVKEAKTNAGSLLSSIRVLTKKIKLKEPRPPATNWLVFAYTLIEIDADAYLARLVTEGVVEREAVPKKWTFYASLVTPLRTSIRDERSNLARHILICTLPNVIGISIYN